MRNLTTAFLLAALAAVTSVATAGDLFVSYTRGQNGTGTIGKYDSTTGAAVNATLITGLGVPEFITASGQYLFVSDQTRGTIGEYATDGAPVNASLVTGLNNPAGIAVSGNDLFVVSQNNNGVNAGTIGKYNATTGEAISPLLVTGLNGPFGIAVSEGNLFVVTQEDGIVNGGRVTEFNGTTGEPITFLITGLNQPWGIAISGTSLFVTNSFLDQFGRTNRVGKYTTSGATIDASLIRPPAGLLGIAVSGEQLFVTIGGANAVGEYSTSGETLSASFVPGSDAFAFIDVAVAVPEPSSLILAVLGSGVFAATGCRLRNRQS